MGRKLSKLKQLENELALTKEKLAKVQLKADLWDDLANKVAESLYPSLDDRIREIVEEVNYDRRW